MNKAGEKHTAHESSAKHHKTRAPADDATQTAATPVAETDSVDDQPARNPEVGLQPTPEDEVARLQDKLLRLQADYDNFRKRMLREKNEIYENANRELVADLLPILDHLQLGLKAAAEHAADPAFRDGMALIQDQLTSVLFRFGLLSIDVDNKAFDPNFAEALNALPSETVPEGMVLAQIRRGYLFKNRLLRPAQVIVSSGLPDAAPTNETEASADILL